MAKGPTEERETLRAAIADYATLIFGVVLVGTQIVEYIQGEIQGSKIEIGSFFIGLLLIVKPTILVDIANTITDKLTK